MLGLFEYIGWAEYICWVYLSKYIGWAYLSIFVGQCMRGKGSSEEMNGANLCQPPMHWTKTYISYITLAARFRLFASICEIRYLPFREPSSNVHLLGFPKKSWGSKPLPGWFGALVQ